MPPGPATRARLLRRLAAAPRPAAFLPWPPPSPRPSLCGRPPPGTPPRRCRCTSRGDSAWPPRLWLPLGPSLWACPPPRERLPPAGPRAGRAAAPFVPSREGAQAAPAGLGPEAPGASARQSLAALRPGAPAGPPGCCWLIPRSERFPVWVGVLPHPGVRLIPGSQNGGAGVHCSWWELCGGQKGRDAWPGWRGLQPLSVTSGVGMNLRLHLCWRSGSTLSLHEGRFCLLHQGLGQVYIWFMNECLGHFLRRRLIKAHHLTGFISVCWLLCLLNFEPTYCHDWISSGSHSQHIARVWHITGTQETLVEWVADTLRQSQGLGKVQMKVSLTFFFPTEHLCHLIGNVLGLPFVNLKGSRLFYKICVKGK